MINGVLNIYKEKGYTSHDVVAKLRKITGQKRIGHTGTLDPDAEGVLPVCLGKATKLCSLLTDQSKTYKAVLLLGVTTDTQDMTGDIIEKRETSHLTDQQVSDCIHGYIGEYEQIPPMYSALKVHGRKLYELAREGITVERQKRTIFIHDIRILDICLPRVIIEVRCSKGTYIRTLCHDIGMTLGCGGCMEKLLRTQVGPFLLKESRTLQEIAELYDSGRMGEILWPPDRLFEEKRALHILPEYAGTAYNGNAFPKTYLAEPYSLTDKEIVRIYDSDGRFIGLFCCSAEEKKLFVEKMFL